FDGTGIYALVKVRDIIDNGTQYYGKPVRVMNASVSDAGSFAKGYGSDPTGWVKFEITDSSSTTPLVVYCEGGANRPLSLVDGDLINIFALLDEYSGDWELNVRKDTLDRVALIPPVYNLRTLGELLSDELAHQNELVRIVDAKVVTASSYIWTIGDSTTTESAKVYAEVGANRSEYINVSDTVVVQGLFTYYDYDQDGPDDDEWEIKVRDAGDDKVERTAEFDYPPVILSMTREPLEPSPFSTVTINASISDNIGVAGSTLLYSLNAGAETAVAMTGLSGQNWTGTIPAAAAGTNVTYRVRAADGRAQETMSPADYYVVVDKPPVIIDVVRYPRAVTPDNF
ncbi:hypothetical protein L0Y59_01560, partial [Candidatus Uhrbacteria bacterium]|nr:hypothetical protein [Candidatus Uhrbacteria bacterium]